MNMTISSLNPRFEILDTYSKISDLPIVGFLPEYGLYVAAFKNFVMGYEEAVLMLANHVYKVHPTPMMKRKAYNEFRKLIQLGVIDKPSWIYNDSQDYKINSRFNKMTALARDVDIGQQDFIRVVDKTNAVTI